MCWQLQSNAVVFAAEWGFCVWISLYALFCYFTTQQIILWSVFSNLIFPRSAKMINFVFRCRFPNFQNKQNIKLYRTTGTTSNYWCIVCPLVSLSAFWTNKQKLDHLEQQLFHGYLNGIYKLESKQCPNSVRVKSKKGGST